MRLGINREEMLGAYHDMGEDRKWDEILQPLIDSYEKKAEIWYLRALEYEKCGSDLLVMQCRARINAYKEIVEDLKKIQPANLLGQGEWEDGI
jgi:hypothetical protein